MAPAQRGRGPPLSVPPGRAPTVPQEPFTPRSPAAPAPRHRSTAGSALPSACTSGQSQGYLPQKIRTSNCAFVLSDIGLIMEFHIDLHKTRVSSGQDRRGQTADTRGDLGAA